MRKQKLLGIGLMVLSILIVCFYGYLLFLTNESISILVLKVTVFLIIVLLSAAIAWIGYTLSISPPSKPVEEIKKEIEEELKRLEEELSKNQG